MVLFGMLGEITFNDLLLWYIVKDQEQFDGSH